MSEYLLSVYFVSITILNPLQFTVRETEPTDVNILSEITQPVNIVLCSPNGYLHAYPTSSPGQAPEDTTQIMVWKSRRWMGKQ